MTIFIHFKIFYARVFVMGDLFLGPFRFGCDHFGIALYTLSKCFCDHVGSFLRSVITFFVCNVMVMKLTISEHFK